MLKLIRYWCRSAELKMEKMPLPTPKLLQLSDLTCSSPSKLLSIYCQAQHLSSHQFIFRLNPPPCLSPPLPLPSLPTKTKEPFQVSHFLQGSSWRGQQQSILQLGFTHPWQQQTSTTNLWARAKLLLNLSSLQHSWLKIKVSDFPCSNAILGQEDFVSWFMRNPKPHEAATSRISGAVQ